MRPPEFKFQCSATSKRSSCRCKNYACRGRSTCRMHGGTSKRGSNHPNFRHGRCVKESLRGLEWLKPRPIRVEVLLFPQPLEEIVKRLHREQLRGLIVPPDCMRVGDWMRALRTARRMLAKELAELRAEIENEPSEDTSTSSPDVIDKQC